MAEKLLITDEEKFAKMTEEWIELAEAGDFEGIYATRVGCDAHFRFDYVRGEKTAQKCPQVFAPIINTFTENFKYEYSRPKQAEKLIKTGLELGKSSDIKTFEAIWMLMQEMPGTYCPNRTVMYGHSTECATILIWLCAQGHITKRRLILEFNKAMMMNTDFEWNLKHNGQNMFKKLQLNMKGL